MNGIAGRGARSLRRRGAVRSPGAGGRCHPDAARRRGRLKARRPARCREARRSRQRSGPGIGCRAGRVRHSSRAHRDRAPPAAPRRCGRDGRRGNPSCGGPLTPARPDPSPTGPADLRGDTCGCRSPRRPRSTRTARPARGSTRGSAACRSYRRPSFAVSPSSHRKTHPPASGSRTATAPARPGSPALPSRATGCRGPSDRVRVGRSPRSRARSR